MHLFEIISSMRAEIIITNFANILVQHKNQLAKKHVTFDLLLNALSKTYIYNYILVALPPGYGVYFMGAKVFLRNIASCKKFP